MTLVELVRKYQRYNPETGTFDRVRTQRDYAAELGVPEDTLSRFLADQRPQSWVILRAFLRTYPHASNAASKAIAESEPAPVAS